MSSLDESIFDVKDPRDAEIESLRSEIRALRVLVEVREGDCARLRRERDEYNAHRLDLFERFSQAERDEINREYISRARIADNHSKFPQAWP